MRGLEKFIDRWVGGLLCLFFSPFKVFFIKKKNNWQKILIIKLSAIGDIILLMPTLKILKEHFPNVTIDVLSSTRVYGLLDGFEPVRRVHYINTKKDLLNPFRLLTLINKLRKENYDVVFDLGQYSRVNALIGLTITKGELIGFHLPYNPKKWLFSNFMKYPPNEHESVTFSRILHFFGINEKPKLVPPIISETDKERAIGFIKNHVDHRGKDELWVVFHPGTGYSTQWRQWEIGKYAELGDWLMKNFNAKIFITGTEYEKKLAETISSKMEKKPIILNGKLNIKELAAFLSLVDLVIIPDTGPAHLAAAMGTRVIGLYGPTNPKKWRILGNSEIIYKNFPCSPCIIPYRERYKKCKDPQCMKSISTMDVKEAILNLLNVPSINKPRVL